MSIIETWEEDLYDATFDNIYEALVEEYKSSQVSIIDI